MIRFFSFLLKLAVAGTIGAILAGFLGPVHPLFDTGANFRLHLSACLFIAAFLFLLRRSWPFFLLSFLSGLIGLAFSWSGTPFSATRLAADPDRPVYQVLHFNMLYNNPSKRQAIELFRQVDPDILSLTEASGLWDRHLDSLRGRWPHYYHCPEWGKRGGLKVFSKHRIETGDIHCAQYGTFTKMKMAIGGAEIDFAATHFRWPWPASGPKQIDAARPILEETGPDALVTGDFNSATWTWAVRRFAEYGGFEVVPGIGSTWMINWFPPSFAGWAGLPIDNVMRKGKVRVLSAQTLEPAGSDHLPVLVRFQLD